MMNLNIFHHLKLYKDVLSVFKTDIQSFPIRYFLSLFFLNNKKIISQIEKVTENILAKHSPVSVIWNKWGAHQKSMPS